MNSVNYREIEKFLKIAEEMWDPNGKFKPIHKFNSIRKTSFKFWFLLITMKIYHITEIKLHVDWLPHAVIT